MNHTDFYARIRAIKEMEYRELYAAIELHGASYEWNSNDGGMPRHCCQYRQRTIGSG